jgi:hypothetical protein
MEDITKKLTVFFEDIAQTTVKFPEVDLAETKREIFDLVNKKEIDVLMQKQIHCSRSLASTNNTCQALLYVEVIIHQEPPSKMNHQQPAKVPKGVFTAIFTCSGTPVSKLS